jgi:hypothetical protein
MFQIDEVLEDVFVLRVKLCIDVSLTFQSPNMRWKRTDLVRLSNGRKREDDAREIRQVKIGGREFLAFPASGPPSIVADLALQLAAPARFQFGVTAVREAGDGGHAKVSL